MTPPAGITVEGDQRSGKLHTYGDSGRLVERARPTYAAIREQVRGSPVINSDETSARVAGRTQSQWTFQTPEASYHLIAPSRGGEVIAAFLGVWVTGLSDVASQAQTGRRLSMAA
jgi:hypothetical protein